MRHFLVLGAACLMMTPGPVWGQAADGRRVEAPADRVPSPYDPEEFPVWARRLRRGEIIAFGVFPLAMFASRVLFEYGRFLVDAVSGGEMQPPWPLGQLGETQFSPSEAAGVVIGAIVLSVAASVADAVLSRRLREAADEDATSDREG